VRAVSSGSFGYATGGPAFDMIRSLRGGSRD
jgi:hypothetical protein